MSNIIVRSNPVELLSDFDRIFDSVFNTSTSLYARQIPVDVREENNSYILEAELPGFNENDVDIRVEDRLLVIESKNSEQKANEKTENTRTWMLRERSSRTFRRSFSLPKDANQDAIEAVFGDGILTLTIGKNEKLAPRTIQIKRA